MSQRPIALGLLLGLLLAGGLLLLVANAHSPGSSEPIPTTDHGTSERTPR